jgi:LSD1 subclass zinc finger protein
MAGRYGSDSFNMFLSVVAIVFLAVWLVFRWLPFYLIAMVFIAATLFRSFSRNAWRRSRENQAYQKIRRKLFSGFGPFMARVRQRKTHRFFKCKSCRTMLRVPKGRGKIRVTCPKCHTVFEADT